MAVKAEVKEEVSDEEFAGFHGNNERVSVQNLQDGLRILYESVLDVSSTP